MSVCLDLELELQLSKFCLSVSGSTRTSRLTCLCVLISLIISSKAIIWLRSPLVYLRWFLWIVLMLNRGLPYSPRDCLLPVVVVDASPPLFLPPKSTLPCSFRILLMLLRMFFALEGVFHFSFSCFIIFDLTFYLNKSHYSMGLSSGSKSRNLSYLFSAWVWN